MGDPIEILEARMTEEMRAVRADVAQLLSAAALGGPAQLCDLTYMLTAMLAISIGYEPDPLTKALRTEAALRQLPMLIQQVRAPSGSGATH